MSSDKGFASPFERDNGLAARAVVTAASQLATMALGAGLAVVVLLRFGKTAETDAVFAAYAVYSVLVIVCFTLRMTVTGQLAHAGTPFASFNAFIGGGLTLALLAGVVLLLMGGPLAAAVAGGLGQQAQETARSAMAILWLAVVAQLVAGLGAALLASADRFGWTGLAYPLGGLVAIAIVLLVAPLLGILAVPVGIATGSALTAAVMLAVVAGSGFRLNQGAVLEGLRNGRTVALMVSGSVLSLVVQVDYALSLSLAGRLAVGSVTLYSYAFALAAVLTGVTGTTGAYVLAAPLARTWDRQPGSLEPYVRVASRAGLLTILPSISVVVLAGDDVVSVILGRSLSPADAHTITWTFLGLTGFLLAMLALQVPLLAAFTLSRHRRVALVSLPVVGVHFGVTELAYATGELPLLGVAASVSMGVLALVVVAIVFGRQVWLPMAVLGGELARLAPVSALSFAPAWLLAGALGNGAWDVVSAAGSVALFAILLRLMLPDHVPLLGRTVHAMLMSTGGGVAHVSAESGGGPATPPPTTRASR